MVKLTPYSNNPRHGPTTGIPAGDGDITIPERFYVAIRNHAAMFSARLSDKTLKSSLILAVVGAPGHGKSEMIVASARQLGIPLQRLSASSLGGMYEGDSTSTVSDTYLRLGKRQDVFPVPCILIEDFDLSSGRTDERLSGTINAALLNGFLMNICDHPDQLTINPADAKPGMPRTQNVAPSMMIITANDATQIYSPLLRPGRASIFEWTPRQDELKAMVQSVFKHLDQGAIAIIVNTFSAETIAFFSQIKQTLSARAIDGLFASNKSQNLLSNQNFISSIVSNLKEAAEAATVEDILQCGTSLKAAKRQSRNYLAPGGGGVT